MSKSRTWNWQEKQRTRGPERTRGTRGLRDPMGLLEWEAR